MDNAAKLVELDVKIFDLRQKLNRTQENLDVCTRDIQRKIDQMQKQLEEQLGYPKKRTIWCRLGVTVPIDEDLLYDIMERNHRGCIETYGRYCSQTQMDDYTLKKEEAAVLMKRAIADGDSYIPAVCFDEHIDWWQSERRKREIEARKEQDDGTESKEHA